MSIRKRLFLSNAAMVLMPIVVIILIILLLVVILNGGFEFPDKRWHGPQPQNTELNSRLTKTASLNQEKLLDREFLESVLDKSGTKNNAIIVRKDEKIVQTAGQLGDISNADLPAYGNEGFNPAGIRLDHSHYSVKQHDFYFQDGTKGTLFVLNNSASFVKFARTFFPILFISLLLVLIITNVLLSYFMSRSILGPVKHLAAAAKKIKSGNLDFTITPKKNDELGQLVQSFDDMRAQLKESLELREKYENNRRQLIANISHDLKTPITSIIGYVEGIQDGVAHTEAKHARYLDTIHGKATYMNRLIEELSLYSKLDVKRLPFQFEAVHISAFVRDYIDEITDELNERNIHISLESNQIDAVVKLDRDKMIRVFENIIYNSVKYTDKETCDIQISLADKGTLIEITIVDNGPGVTEGELTQIFSRFYRTDPSRNTDGSGLGLAIAAQIIETHGGTIWAVSKLGEGLSIHFTLSKSDGGRHEEEDISY
ncbi:sensor histidine kinase [Virgibacillus siamensis]|uniref:sensor histidine kinase n=1 Tax=Virgibacillus siamensis TaxID=480071 RepID=UPI0009871BD4|nr:HAMP domain-containing sensor histidine kinase [Virgibacillus siamensis]